MKAPPKRRNRWPEALATAVLLAVAPIHASPPDLQSAPLPYHDGETVLKGYHLRPKAGEGPWPGVVLFPEWWGQNAYAKRRARQIARQGYAVLIADLYGGGRSTQRRELAEKWSSALYRSPEKLRRRARAGLDALSRAPHVAGERIAAVGYGFGGSVALELAYDGAEIAGVAAFHSGLPMPTDEATIRGRLLLFQGADNPLAPLGEIAKLARKLRAAGASWEMHLYGGAGHAFANPASGHDGREVTSYAPKAAQRAHAALEGFLERLIKPIPEGR